MCGVTTIARLGLKVKVIGQGQRSMSSSIEDSFSGFKCSSQPNLNCTLPFLTTTPMKSLLLSLGAVCPCHSSSPFGWSVTTVNSIVSALLSPCVNRDRGISMKPPDDENSAAADIGATTTDTIRYDTIRSIFLRALKS